VPSSIAARAVALRSVSGALRASLIEAERGGGLGSTRRRWVWTGRSSASAPPCLRRRRTRTWAGRSPSS